MGCSRACSNNKINMISVFTLMNTPVYRIFGDLKFVASLGVLGGAESKNRITFVHLVRISHYRTYVL